MSFTDGLLFGLGFLCAAMMLGGSTVLAWAWWERRQPEPAAEPEAEDEPEMDEDPRPEWMKSRNGKPYDPTAGYEPKRSRKKRALES